MSFLLSTQLLSIFSHLCTNIDLFYFQTIMCRKIFAFDIDPKRIATMKKLLHRAGEQITVIKNEDFLKVGAHHNVII